MAYTFIQNGFIVTIRSIATTNYRMLPNIISVSRLWGQSIMILIHPIHPPPVILCGQIEHFQAAIREFNSMCVTSCPLVNQEKTFQKLKIAMTHCVRPAQL